MLTYTYDHQYSSGDEKGQSTGQKATIKVQMKLGATTIYSDTIEDVSSGSYQLDLTKYLQLGTTDIYVIASTTDPLTGKSRPSRHTRPSRQSRSRWHHHSILPTAWHSVDILMMRR